jgi:hypothetical protein
MTFQKEANRVPTSIPIFTVMLIDNTGDEDASVDIGKHARFRVRVFDQNGDILREFGGDLKPHLTAGQIAELLDIMTDLRAQAEEEILPT